MEEDGHAVNPRGDAKRYQEIADKYAKGKIDEWKIRKSTKTMVAYADYINGKRVIVTPPVNSPRSLYIALHEISHWAFQHPREDKCSAKVTIGRTKNICLNSYYEYLADVKAMDVMRSNGVKVPESVVKFTKRNIGAHATYELRNGVEPRGEVLRYAGIDPEKYREGPMKKRNPEGASQAMYESFHGRPSEEVVEFEEQEHFHENLAGLGVLVELRVHTVTGLDRSLSFDHDNAVDAKGNPVWPFGPGQPLGSRTTVTHIDKRSRAVTTTTGSGNHKSYQILKHGDGTFEVPQIDRESRFDTKRDAQRFIDDEVKYARNPIGGGNEEPALASSLVYQLKRRKLIDDHAGRILEMAIRRTALTYPESIAAVKLAIRNSGGGVATGQAMSNAFQKLYNSPAARKKLDSLHSQRLDYVVGAKKLTSEDEVGQMIDKAIPRRNPDGPISSTIGFGGKILGDLDRRVGKAIGFGKNKRKSNPEPISTTTTLLTSNEDGTQLYFVGGDQSVDLEALKFSEIEQEKDLVTIGDCFFVSYLTQKDFDNLETICYEHELGEESGVLPQLIYDTRNKKLMLSGGEYHIERPMLETSPGIEN